MNAASGRVAILDMREPVLSELQAGALAWAESSPAIISADAILAAAVEETGLSDFGPDDFRARLELWVQAIEAETDLTELVRHGLRLSMVRFAANRLRVEHEVRRHPQILDIEIDRPLILAGLPRSGTTYLQNVLSADDRLRSLPFWEAMRPVPASPDENGDPASDPRHARAAEAWRGMDALLPYLKMTHPFDPDHISEDIELQCVDFGSYFLEWAVPSHIWFDHYWNTDQTGSYRYLRKVLQVLTFHRGPNRWLLKCPQHMEQAPAVHAVFPDATLVINHRDPVASIQSAITSLGYSSRTRVRQVQPEKIADYWIERYGRLLDRCVRDRDALGGARVEDVYFHELMADPMAVIARIYAKAGLEMTADAQATLADALQEHVRGKYGSLDYDLRRDFGLEPAKVRERFAAYTARFPVEIEVR